MDGCTHGEEIVCVCVCVWKRVAEGKDFVAHTYIATILLQVHKEGERGKERSTNDEECIVVYPVCVCGEGEGKGEGNPDILVVWMEEKGRWAHTLTSTRMPRAS